MAKIKKEFLGQKTFSRTLNKMMIIEPGAELTLLADGRTELFEQEEKKILKPAKKKLKKKIEEDPIEKIEEIDSNNNTDLD